MRELKTLLENYDVVICCLTPPVTPKFVAECQSLNVHFSGGMLNNRLLSNDNCGPNMAICTNKIVAYMSSMILYFILHGQTANAIPQPDGSFLIGNSREIVIDYEKFISASADFIKRIDTSDPDRVITGSVRNIDYSE